MKFRSLVIWVILILSLVPIYFIHRMLQRKIRPKKSLLRLFIYLMTAFGLIFFYTFFLVWLVTHLFPISTK